ncbi:MAG: hypothetical protein LBJ10_08840 [Clostridiales bacterium]|jgi:hypothetical protein|nr:hypothetical protein [Clostridiales bacterium]
MDMAINQRDGYNTRGAPADEGSANGDNTRGASVGDAADASSPRGATGGESANGGATNGAGEPRYGAARAVGAQRLTLYEPNARPGFVAWATAFDYGDGGIGLSFKETVREGNPGFAAPTLEAVEAAAVPYSYGSVFFGGSDFRSYWVYMRSDDCGLTFRETGRAPLGQGSDINLGFPDGRIVGYHTPPDAEPGLARSCIRAMESLDGGSSWRQAATLLAGCSIYLWRVRRLRDGMAILMASLYGTAWGPGQERATRNTMLPGETQISKVQPFFMASRDGISFTGPHYILPGTGAHEFDMVELGDGEMLFFQGDVQATPPARQKVRRRADGIFINEPVHAVRRGSPQGSDPQGGFLPETIVRLPGGANGGAHGGATGNPEGGAGCTGGGLLVGARRGKPYSCSPDEGENWYEIDGLPPSLYQPFMMVAPDGALINFGHFGGDSAFGQKDMFIGADRFRVDSRLPGACRMSLERCLSADGSRYLNRFRARLTSGGVPVAGMEAAFFFQPFWPMAEQDPALAPRTAAAATDADGCAEAGPEGYADAGDIHFSYSARAAFAPPDGSGFLPCESPTMQVQALRAVRGEPYPYGAYFAEGTLYLSPALLEAHPGALGELRALAGRPDGLVAGQLSPGLADALIRNNVLATVPGGRLKWKPSVHAPVPLADVRPMASGDVFA